VTSGEKSKIRDVFGFLRLKEGIYSNAQIDRSWTTEIMKDFTKWIGASEEGKPYQHLNWDEEFEAAKKADETQHIGQVRE